MSLVKEVNEVNEVSTPFLSNSCRICGKPIEVEYWEKNQTLCSEHQRRFNNKRNKGKKKRKFKNKN